MAVFNETGLLADTLLEGNPEGLKLLIGIDGKDGVGKSTLTCELSQKLPALVIGLDDFIEKRQDKYVSALYIDRLREAIQRAKGIVLIDGVCLLAAMKEACIKLDSHIYVKRMHHGLWMDEDVCHIEGSADEAIKKQEEDLLAFLLWEAASEGKNPPSIEDAKLSGLTQEIIRYHATFRPSECADHVFEAEHK